MVRDFDYNEFPLAYLLTFRTYGTWLHGDERFSVDRRHNVYGASKIKPNSRLERSDEDHLKGVPVILDARRRQVVEKALREVCVHGRYSLQAINVRTNHVHVVVCAFSRPEPVLGAFKAYATRALRNANLLLPKVRPWSRHGSTVYLWKEKAVAKAIEYVLLSQGDELFRLDDNAR